MALLAVCAAVLRFVAITRYRIDSDEMQHLHVAWGWSVGLLQYRDVFDNHGPLFHLLASQLFRLGERPDIAQIARLPMIAVYAAVSLSVFAIARRLSSTRIALWCVLLLSFFPSFFRRSVECRTDNLWLAFWMAALWWLLRASPSPARLFAGGLLLGCAMSVSLKTALLVYSLSIAGVLLLPLSRRERADAGARLRPLAATLAFCAGFVALPLLIAAWFARAGALNALIFGTVTFNDLYENPRRYAWVLKVLYPLFMLLAALAARRLLRSAMRERERVAFLFLLFSAYAITLVCFWPMIGDRDLLPLAPGAAILAAPLLCALPRRSSALAAAALCVAFLIAALPWVRSRDYFWQRAMMDDVVRLTRPGERIMSLKGEHVYRERPVYPIYEKVTRSLVERGLLRDDGPEEIVAKGCWVAMPNSGLFPPRTRRFLLDNFIEVGILRVAGHDLAADGSFNIALPGRYTILGPGGVAAGLVDGTLSPGSVELTAGRHTFAGSGEGPFAVVWAEAVTRGYSPFHKLPVERPRSLWP